MEHTDFTDIGRIEAIERLFEGSGFERKGVFSPGEGSSVVGSSRLLLEGTDFNLVYFPLKHLGYKTVVAVTGGLHASLAHPKSLEITLGVSSKLDFSKISELWSGILAGAREQGYEDLSLDLIPSQNGLAIGVSAHGEIRKESISRRPSPKTKDLICVSGALGAAYLGMRVLEKGLETFGKTGEQPDLGGSKMFVGAYLKPELSPETVSRLEEASIYPSSGYLVSKGLADAVKRLSRETGLGAKIYADRIPFEGNTFSLAKELDIDPVSAAMNGGDDYRLLFTIPILEAEKFRREFQGFDVIGHLALPEAGTVLVTPDGVELPLKAQGWPDNE